ASNYLPVKPRRGEMAPQSFSRLIGRLSRRGLAGGDVVQGDDPTPVYLAHQSSIDAVLRVLGADQLEAANQLGRIGGEHLYLDIVKTQRAGGGAVVPNVVIECPLPAVLKAAAGDEYHAGVLEAFHIAAEISAIPGILHAVDDIDDLLLVRLGG